MRRRWGGERQGGDWLREGRGAKRMKEEVDRRGRNRVWEKWEGQGEKGRGMHKI